MKYEKKVVNQVVLIKIFEPRIDTSKSPDLKKELLGWIVQDLPNLVLDLAKVEYMDSSGLGAILFGIRQAQRFQGNLVIINLGQQVKKLLEIAHLTKTISVFASEKEALMYFAQKQKI